MGVCAYGQAAVSCRRSSSRTLLATGDRRRLPRCRLSPKVSWYWINCTNTACLPGSPLAPPPTVFAHQIRAQKPWDALTMTLSGCCPCLTCQGPWGWGPSPTRQ